MKNAAVLRVLVIAVSLAGAAPMAPALAQDDGPPPVVNVLQVRDNIYMLVGQGGNITMQVGDDGILIVDTQFARMSESIVAAEIHVQPVIVIP